MNRIFDYELIHTTAVLLTTGSGDKYQECNADISEDEVMDIALALADRGAGRLLRNDEEAQVYTGWLIIDRNNDGDAFDLTNEDGRWEGDASAERAQELFLAYIRESVDNNVEVSAANLALIGE